MAPIGWGFAKTEPKTEPNRLESGDSLVDPNRPSQIESDATRTAPFVSVRTENRAELTRIG